MAERATVDVQRIVNTKTWRDLKKMIKDASRPLRIIASTSPLVSMVAGAGIALGAVLIESQLQGERNPSRVERSQTDQDQNVIVLDEFVPRSTVSGESLTVPEGHPLNYSKALENLQRTFSWMESHKDQYISQVPERIAPYLWSMQRLPAEQYVMIAYLPIDTSGTIDLKVLVSTDMFDNDMSENDISEAARQLYYARFLILAAHKDPIRFTHDPVYRAKTEQEVYQMPFTIYPVNK